MTDSPRPRDYDGLAAYLAERMRTPFAWGRSKNDCVSFGLGAVRVQTRRDVLKGTNLRWGSKRGARRVVLRLGGLEAAVDRYLEETPVGMAQRGDIGLIDGPDGPLLAVFDGEVVLGPSEMGLLRLPRAVVRKAWDASSERRPAPQA